MNAIVVIDDNYAIGCEGALLYDLPGDLKHFARMTRGKTIVMGRLTLASFPGGKPLPGRTNIVLTRQEDFAMEGVVAVHSREELAEAVQGIPEDEVMLIGGECLFNQLIDCCRTAYVTKVKACAPADRFFPNLEQKSNWRLVGCGEEQEENGWRYTICKYVNQAVQPLMG